LESFSTITTMTFSRFVVFLPLFKNPIVWICLGVILLGAVAFLWAVMQLFKSEPQRNVSSAQDDLGLAAGESATDDLLSDPLAIAKEPVRAPSAATGGPVSREVADRLESMSQRLAEMQNVLARQSGDAPAGAGQGFSPETVDKLLRIIGNVTQQVDILQRALNIPKAGGPPPNSPA
jgi:hypothetical protein